MMQLQNMIASQKHQQGVFLCNGNGLEACLWRILPTYSAGYVNIITPGEVEKRIKISEEVFAEYQLNEFLYQVLPQGYDDLGRLYTHFPGGTGDGYSGVYPIVLDSDKGDYYDITIAFYYNYVFGDWQGAEIRGETDEDGRLPRKAMTVYNATQLIRADSHRSATGQCPLDKKRRW